MSILFVIMPVAMVVIGIAIAAYVWAARRGQFDDLTTPAVRMLHDDPPRADGVATETRAAPPER